MQATGRRILLTGGGGFIGGALARRLTTAGHCVRVLDLPEIAACGLGGDVVGHDLTTALPASILRGIDTVVHAAALAGVQPSWARPAAYWEVNMRGTERLRAACESAGAPRVVHLSSISVYGEGLNLSERSAPAPLSPYGESKLAGERVWDGYPHATIVRLSNVYGPGQRPDMAYATFIRAAFSGAAITLRDGGRQLRTPTYIDDAVAGIVAALDHGRDGEIYNVAGPEDIRLSEIPRLLGGLLGHPVACGVTAPAPGDPRVATVSSDHARRALGYAARTSVRAGLAAQIEAAARSTPAAVSVATS